MFIWIPVLFVLLVLSVFLLILGNKKNSIGLFGVSILSIAILFIPFITIIAESISFYSTMIDYSKIPEPVICEQQCTLDEAEEMIAQDKRNLWIEQAQTQKTKWGAFSLYPDGVMELKVSE